MENIPLPSKITINDGEEPNSAVISIQPCQPGYGNTLGNALRRVLLSSLPGGAVTAFKIKGVSHEFSSIDNVAEDAVEISLNLKQLRLKIHSDEPVRLELKVKGEKQVTAGDIKTTSDVEVVNKDLVIATLTDKDATLEMELIAEQGRGYLPTEVREGESTETDMIITDAIFTPVRKVGINVENVRVGKMTNFENLLLTIETDGTISPKEALEQSTKILIDHFNFISENTQGSAKAKIKEEDVEEVTEETPES